ncbi:MAG: DNA-binding protein [Candidatus Bilamarchaeaceae archaeon]
MISRSHRNVFIIRFDNGEEIIKSLQNFCHKNKISGGYFNGIGACKETTISYFDIQQNKYIEKRIKENCEIVSISGFITTIGQKKHIHAHISLANKKNKVIGGHLKETITSPTCEIFLVKTKNIKRKKDKKTGLMFIN